MHRTCALVLVSLLAVACTGPYPERRTFEFRGPTMGTTYSVKVVTGSAGLNSHDRGAIDSAIHDELARIDALMSTWDPKSELSRFNRSTTLEPFQLSTETFEVFRWAVEFSLLTGGAFDITVAPLVDAWGFGPSGPRDRTPSDAEIAHLREAIGMQHLELRPAVATVRKTRPDVQCDFSALAAGYVADRIAVRLAEQGSTDFLIDMGGELRARGRNDDGGAWRIAIDRPQTHGRSIQRMVEISDLAIATSGDYRNFRELDATRVVHILDPRTGRPVRHLLASVTVLDELAVRADAISTALMVLGPEEGVTLAKRLDLAALFLVRDEVGGFTEVATARFDALTRARGQ